MLVLRIRLLAVGFCDGGGGWDCGLTIIDTVAIVLFTFSPSVDLKVKLSCPENPLFGV
jgi:hypothetical protein